MKKVCIITNYYPPEKGAAANRIETLALGLRAIGHDVVVICPLPNYPQGEIFKEYRWKLYEKEQQEGIDVRRLWIYATISTNKWKRLFAMLSFSTSLMVFKIFNSVPDTVIIQSPPLIIANTAIRLLKSKGRKLILNVSDLWPKAGVELGVLQPGKQLKKLEAIEHYNYKNANVILGQSHEILNHVRVLVPIKNCVLYRNFPEIKGDIKTKPFASTQGLKILYAGLLGVAQGILNVCKHIELPDNIELHIYGNGAERDDIKHFLESSGKNNISYLGEVSKEEIQLKYEVYDVALVPLVKRIYGSVPSKIYELAHFGLPILYMAGGEGEEIVERFGLGKVIQPNDFEELNSVLKELNKVSLHEKRDHILERASENLQVAPQIKILSRIIQD